MNDWMHALARQYGELRRRNPDDRLLVVFDIDGTILDMRYMVRHVLLSYDREHGTGHFHGLEVDDITFHENDVDAYLATLPLAAEARRTIFAWYLDNRWSPDSVLASHRPYRGVLDVIRWFQIQDRTFVALNTGRPEEIRAQTLHSLNALGREYRVRFDSELLHMNPHRGEELMTLDTLMDLMNRQAESFKLDLTEGGDLIDRVLERIHAHNIVDQRLWFNGDIEILRKDGFRNLLDAHPHAVI